MLYTDIHKYTCTGGQLAVSLNNSHIEDDMHSCEHGKRIPKPSNLCLRQCYSCQENAQQNQIGLSYWYLFHDFGKIVFCRVLFS